MKSLGNFLLVFDLDRQAANRQSRSKLMRGHPQADLASLDLLPLETHE
jgi:hypothetical protein